MRASGECGTAVIRFQERTEAELKEYVVCFSSTEGNNSHQGRHQQSLFVGTVANRKRGAGLERPHWEEAQEGLH